MKGIMWFLKRSFSAFTIPTDSKNMKSDETNHHQSHHSWNRRKKSFNVPSRHPWSLGSVASKTRHEERTDDISAPGQTEQDVAPEANRKQEMKTSG
jgi:hypothetical protein